MQLLNSTFPLREESPLSVAVTAALPTIDDTQKLPVHLILMDEDRKVAVKPLPVPRHPLLSDTDRVLMSRWSAIIKSSLAKGIGAIFELGDNLVAAKKAVGHGLFLVILKELVRFCPRQAQKYMRIASKGVLRNPNYVAVIPHTVSVLYPLSGLDDLSLVQGLERAKLRIKHGKKFNVDRLDSWQSLIPNLGQAKTEVKGTARATKTEGFQLAKEIKAPSTPASADLANNDPSMEATATSDEAKLLDNKPGGESVAEVTLHAVSPTPNDHVSTPAKPAVGEKAKEATEVMGEPENPKGLAIQAPAPSELAKDEKFAEGQAQQPAANDNHNDVDRPTLNALRAEIRAFSTDEINSGNALYRLWSEKVAPEWLKHPKKVRIFTLKWLLAEAMEEDSKAKAA